jgi:acyl-coenzyme A thioesterase PaaI-like protein
MTRHLEVDYKRPVPSATAIRMEGRIVRSEGRKHWVEANILDHDGKILAHSKGLFIEVTAR